MILKLYKVVKKEKVDLIHAHNYEGAIIGYIVKKLTGKQLLYNAVNTMIDELPAYDFIRPRSLAVGMAKVLDYLVPRGADFITAVSQGLRSFLISKGVDGNRIVVVPAGVFPEMFEDGDPKKVRSRFGIADKAIVIYTGTLDRFQRIDYLLKAFKIVADSNKNVLLLIVANMSKPDDIQNCQDMIKKLDLENQVILHELSSLDDLKDYLLSGDVAVLPRPSCPGHPVKLLNYMAAGRAIVAFKGAGRGIQDLNNGLLVEDHDWNQLGQKILHLVKNDRLRESLGRNAWRTVRDHFNWQKIVKGISVIYEGMTCSKAREKIVIDEKRFCKFIPREL